MIHRHVLLITVTACAGLTSSLEAGGLIPDRINQILVQGRFDQPEQPFLVVFSKDPLANRTGRLIESATGAQLSRLDTNDDRVVLKLYGKPATRKGRYDFFFGTLHDANRPWNDGTDFHWEDWENHSPDVWDHVAICALPGRQTRVATISSVTIRRGGKVLFDSSATKSYTNKRPIRVALRPFTLRPRNGKYPVLNLSDEMASFGTRFYELGENPILQLAYSDLGQTEKSKYANRGRNWCSEFTSWIYRENDIETPDPNAGDVHFVNMAESLSKVGTVYPMREVLSWSDDEKRKKIKPGSFVSILNGQFTHSLIFTTWVTPEDGQPITHYAGISGNNKAMVWAHSPLKLPDPEIFESMSQEELADYDRKVYFGVPHLTTR